MLNYKENNIKVLLNVEFVKKVLKQVSIIYMKELMSIVLGWMLQMNKINKKNKNKILENKINFKGRFPDCEW